MLGLVVIPSLRLNRFKSRLHEMKLDSTMIQNIMNAFEQEIEVGSRRLGRLCNEPGCKQILVMKQSEGSCRERAACRDHGYAYDRDVHSLVIAFDVLEQDRNP